MTLPTPQLHRICPAQPECWAKPNVHDGPQQAPARAKMGHLPLYKIMLYQVRAPCFRNSVSVVLVSIPVTMEQTTLYKTISVMHDSRTTLPLKIPKQFVNRWVMGIHACDNVEYRLLNFLQKKERVVSIVVVILVAIP